MSTPSPDESKLRRAHPLAAALIERLRTQPHAHVVDIGTGRGRNTDALREAGLTVTAIADDRVALGLFGGPFDGAISTHALLHGTTASVAACVAAVAAALSSGAPFYATFASKQDARYGKGTPVGPDSFAPDGGDEAGVPHAYFGEPELRKMLEPYFAIESLEERDAAGIVGRWAHAQPPHGSVHWLLRAHRA
jgi:hypothetical protein